jgi:hypothetical protein
MPRTTIKPGEIAQAWNAAKERHAKEIDQRDSLIERLGRQLEESREGGGTPAQSPGEPAAAVQFTPEDLAAIDEMLGVAA